MCLIKYRKKGQIVSPLSEEDIALFIEDEYTKDILNRTKNIFQNKKFGNYLISGEQGVGKTTIVNLILSHFEKKGGIYFYFSKNDYDGEKRIYKSFIEQVKKKEKVKNDSNIVNLIKDVSVLLSGKILEKDSTLISDKTLNSEKQVQN